MSAKSRVGKLLLVGVCLALTLSACASANQIDATTTAAGATTTQPLASTTTATTTTSVAPTTTPTTTTSVAPTTTVDSSVSVTVFRELLYREKAAATGRAAAQASTVDVYVPENADGLPAVVLLHGVDQFATGSPTTPLDGLANEIARLGATVFYFKWNTFGGLSSLSADDLSCIGPFVGARAAEFGVDPDRVAIIGHSMGGPAGSNLAFRSFQLTTDADCVESGESPHAAAFLGIGGSYGWAAQPIEGDPSSYLSSTKGDEPQREVSATAEVAPGLIAEQAFELDGYSSMDLAAEDLRVVLLVGTLDPYLATNPARTQGFAAALQAHGIDVQVVEVDGGGHEDVIYPNTKAGTTTLEVIRALLDNLGT